MSAPNASDMASAFDALVADGTYDLGHEHAPAFKALMADGLARAMAQVQAAAPSLLEVGCGAGGCLVEILKAAEADGRPWALHGSDISPKMVALCQARFAGQTPDMQFFAGDILAPSGYGARTYDIIFAYDVVQQLPPRAQYPSVEMMLSQLNPGGVLLMFDNDAHSRYGREMARKKWLTRYLFLPLVPRYFCNAAYPPLEVFAQQLAVQDIASQLIAKDGLHKRIFLVQKPRA